jgi:hypothetical protein
MFIYNKQNILTWVSQKIWQKIKAIYSTSVFSIMDLLFCPERCLGTYPYLNINVCDLTLKKSQCPSFPFEPCQTVDALNEEMMKP